MLDAVLLTGAVAGLIDLVVGGQFTSARRSVLGLLVPGLVGLAVAVVASRLLPVACRALFGPTSRDGRVGGLGGFLAVRHIVRRAGGVRTTMVLTTAFALAGFAVAAWSVNRGNDQLIAGTDVGAPAVLTVSVPPGRDLGAVVDRVDPEGRLAAAVDRYTSLTGGTAGLSVLGVQPQRFARVAYWNHSFAAAPLPSLAAAAAVPAAPANGIVVDRRYAELAAAGNLSGVTEQVWVTAGARQLIEARLAAAHVRVLSVQEAGAVAARLGRQGPGLASVLFLADAAAAAVLAVAGAILGLYLSARRRRYEYAALVASGVARRTLRRALLAEQVAVLGFGAVVGIAAGLVAAAVVLPNVPEFIGPVATPLSYTPPAGQLAVLLGVAAALMLGAAVTASVVLVHGVRLSQLREAPA